jgi:hypothetical protein
MTSGELLVSHDNGDILCLRSSYRRIELLRIVSHTAHSGIRRVARDSILSLSNGDLIRR